MNDSKLSDPVAAKPATPPPFTAGKIKGTRDNVLSAIDKSGLDAEFKALLTKRVNAINPNFDLICVDVHEQTYGLGVNGTYTVTEL